MKIQMYNSFSMESSYNSCGKSLWTFIDNYKVNNTTNKLKKNIFWIVFIFRNIIAKRFNKNKITFLKV